LNYPLSLEKRLLSVEKPGRYIGGEFNASIKEHKPSILKIALSYPDLYEIGMSNYGVRILYDIINRRQDALCERVFAVWTDFEQVLRKNKIGIFSLETQTPLSQFDIIGFSLEYELTYTNMLNILDLASIPIYSYMRNEKHPIIIAGGTAMYNPLPVAAFVDVVVIGEGEEVIEEIIEVVNSSKLKGAERKNIFSALASIEGVYVPSIHTEKDVIKRRYVKNLRPEMYPSKPIVPFIPITHDRLTVEIRRGCTQGCRFCQAGYTTRPVRELSVSDISGIASNGIKQTGWSEVSLLSLSASDHSRIENIIGTLKFQLPNTSISLPSLRGDALTQKLADVLKDIRRSSLTLAPEAGTERLRKAINKNISDDAILNSCEVAIKNGWRKLKLYFMIGLPTETSMDIDGLINLVGDIKKVIGRSALKISISPFVPKPHTAFQRAAQDSVELMREKENYIVSKLGKRRVEVNWRRPEVAFLESVLSTGDESLSKVIGTAWSLGSRFEEWSEEFNFDLWKKAFDHTGIDPYRFTASKQNMNLPWNFIDTGVNSEFLEKEERKTHLGEASEDCFHSVCCDCGVCDEEELRRMGKSKSETMSTVSPEFGRKKRKSVTFSQLSMKRLRMVFCKSDKLKFISHLDTIRLFMRAIRRADIKVAYTKGFRKRPKIAFGPALPLGVSSNREFFDLFFEQPFSGDVKSMLNGVLPKEIRILDTKPVFIKSPSLTKIVSLIQYRIFPTKIGEETIREFMSRDSILVTRRKGEKEIEFDLRPFVHSVVNENGMLNVFLKYLPERSVRIEEILCVLGIPEISGKSMERIGMFAEKQGELIDPFDY